MAASVWSQTIDRAIEVAAKVKAGVVWINATNLFDAGAAFGGFRESGYGREGAREGLYEYLKSSQKNGKERVQPNTDLSVAPFIGKSDRPDIDVTSKLYIGGKQSRADAGQSYTVMGKNGAIGQAALGSRKDIRNAVEAAAKATSWSNVTGHNRAQVLYFFAENLAQRRDEFVEALKVTGASKDAKFEVEIAIRRAFWYAAQADKFDGAVHSTKSRHVTMALHEPWGVMGIVCPDEAPLLAFVSLLLPSIAMGNRAVLIASQSQPLLATKLYQVLETSDVPAGVVNIITGESLSLAKTLAEHDEIAALWYCGTSDGSKMVETASCGNLKPVWSDNGILRDWFDPKIGQGAEYLRRATQVKTIWLPYGE